MRLGTTRTMEMVRGRIAYRGVEAREEEERALSRSRQPHRRSLRAARAAW